MNEVNSATTHIGIFHTKRDLDLERDFWMLHTLCKIKFKGIRQRFVWCECSYVPLILGAFSGDFHICYMPAAMSKWQVTTNDSWIGWYGP